MTAVEKNGVVKALFAFVLWALFPLYWKLLDNVNPFEILMHRMFFSFVFMLIVVYLSGKKEELKKILTNKKQLPYLAGSGILLGINWLIYLWAISNNQMLEASLGYFINPLLNVFLGMIFLNEKLTKMQIGAIILASIGVILQGINISNFPWVSLSVAGSFGVYALLKKKLNLHGSSSMVGELLFLMPIVFGIILWQFTGGSGSFLHDGTSTSLLLIIGGVVTALPLYLFGEASKKIPLSLLGIIQYITPTGVFLLSIFYFKESFNELGLFSFSLIWVAIVIYLFARKSNKQVSAK